MKFDFESFLDMSEGYWKSDRVYYLNVEKGEVLHICSHMKIRRVPKTCNLLNKIDTNGAKLPGFMVEWDSWDVTNDKKSSSGEMICKYQTCPNGTRGMIFRDRGYMTRNACQTSFEIVGGPVDAVDMVTFYNGKRFDERIETKWVDLRTRRTVQSEKGNLKANLAGSYLERRIRPLYSHEIIN